ncbi:MAG: hypothetical protein QNJ61_07755 [Desulfobacterales bacterium]|nr:hypothetical protein [Desulfobacterales bacterium]
MTPLMASIDSQLNLLTRPPILNIWKANYQSHYQRANRSVYRQRHRLKQALDQEEDLYSHLYLLKPVWIFNFGALKDCANALNLAASEKIYSWIEIPGGDNDLQASDYRSE